MSSYLWVVPGYGINILTSKVFEDQNHGNINDKYVPEVYFGNIA